MQRVYEENEWGKVSKRIITHPIVERQRTKTIHGLIKCTGKFVFSDNDGQESTVEVHFLKSPFRHSVLC